MKQQNEKTGFEILFETIIKYRVALLILIAAIVIAGVRHGFFHRIDSSNNEKAEKQFDIALQNLNTLGEDKNASERDELIKQQVQSLVNIVQVYPRTIAAERARLLVGKFITNPISVPGSPQVLQAAYSNYNYALITASSDFYRSLALIGRAQCSEQVNNYVKAFEDYSLVASKYTNQGFAPLALIGMAGCREQMSDINGAVGYYKQLIKDYPDSDWNYFARGKIYFYTENAAAIEASNQGAGAGAVNNGAGGLFSKPAK